ncbi:hypothetical protein CANCADRAFT_42273 [Tortispora caseinolytica NRRL Y-17796]|uniref:Auxin efflux carrier n=1 Tax=Tortispora caseinolytica NRRL Y-17796 TaxID=767744 RepID=A0A1E4TIR9_9ASCO|nr:hypothetical protein CANCADRAFT_42273 [Tortispora caseinolytica NRRL Y-17796]
MTITDRTAISLLLKRKLPEMACAHSVCEWSNNNSFANNNHGFQFLFVGTYRAVLGLYSGNKGPAHTSEIDIASMIFTEMGPFLTVHNIEKLLPIIVQTVCMMLAAYLLAILSVFCGAQDFVVAGAVFNNSTALPLLLVRGLVKSGALDTILPDEGAQLIIKRANAYTLCFSVLHTFLRFSVGPYMMHKTRRASIIRRNSMIQAGMSENLPLLGSPKSDTFSYKAKAVFKAVKHRLGAALNPAVIASLVALLVGITPPLHYLIFDFGPVARSVTAAVSDMGDLYAALQLFALGSQLVAPPERHVSKISLLVLCTIRYCAIPVISMSAVYFLRSNYPDLWHRDPLLDFMLMILPVGPSAVSLAAVAELAGATSHEISVIARVLLVIYIFTPAIAPSVVFALYLTGRLYS